MALMLFREPNQVKWQGVRPAHRGTQVVKSSAAGAGTAIIHTVTAAKIFFLCGLTVGLDITGLGNSGNVHVRDDLDAIRYYLYQQTTGAVGQLTLGRSYFPPIEISADWDICVASSGAFIIIRACIDGWEE